MNSVYEKLCKCVEQIKEKTDFVPEIAITLGTGLGDFGDEVKAVCTIDYKDIEGFPVSTAPYHKGRFIFGYIDDVPVVVMQGRVHYYEGYDVQDVVLPARVCAMLGAKVLFLSNAAGGVNESLPVPGLMLIRDHIMCFYPNPLRGENIPELGVRFPDMTEVYTPALREIIKSVAARQNTPLGEGVYLQLSGPTYETPAEIKMCALLGADAVGMSTACEAAAARHAGLMVCGVSCISNKAAGLGENLLTQEEVEEAGALMGPRFRALVRESVKEIHAYLGGDGR